MFQNFILAASDIVNIGENIKEDAVQLGSSLFIALIVILAFTVAGARSPSKIAGVFIVVFVGVARIFNGENTIDWISNTWNSWSK
jgi:hypothetical protein